MGIRQEQREKRRDAILEAALELFIQKGYAETKIADIAKKTGMSTGLLFHYFESKAKLYEELIKIGISGPAMVMALDASDPLLFFENAAGAIMTALKEHSYVAKMFVLMIQAQFSASLPDSLRTLIRHNSVHEKTIAIMKEGQARGQIKPGSAAALSILFWQALSGVALYAAMRPNDPLPPKEWIIDCIRRIEV